MRLGKKAAPLGALALLTLGLAIAAVRLDLRPPWASPAQPSSACSSGATACAAPKGTADADAELPPGGSRIVEFESAHCAVCQRMAPLVKEIEARCARDAGAVLRVEIDDAHGEALATRYGVRFLPTFLQVDATGQEVDRAVGAQTREALSGLFTQAYAGDCRATL